MPVQNSDIADAFNTIADLLSIKGDNPFRIRAYRQAALTMENLSKDARAMVANKEDLTELPAIGKDLAAKIAEMATTGKLKFLEKLEKSIPGNLSDFMKIQGLGPERVKAIYNKLKVKTFRELEAAAKAGKIRELAGFGEKTEKMIADGIMRVRQARRRMNIAAADGIAKSYIGYLKKVKGVEKIIAAGSYRRHKETVRDLDILVTCEDGLRAMNSFVKYEGVRKVISQGPTRSTVELGSGFHVDLRVVPDASYGAALQYFTGSLAHNIVLRKIAVGKKLKLNEYGLFKGRKTIAGRTEAEVYEKLGLRYIEPELRENTGEIEAARKDKLPALVALDDIRGDFHVHTNATDGHNSLAEMVEAAKKKGYEYVGITDHTKRVTVAHGLKVPELEKQLEEIDRLNAKLKGITILKSSEVDILEDGTLDLPDSVLKKLDLTVCSVHYNFNLPKEKQTERIIRAMDNPYFNILSHPTGRLIGTRDPYEVDMERIIKAAKERSCAMEINSYPDRLDLNDTHCRLAKDVGVKVAISTDSHNTGGLDFMRFGVWQARRGWLGPGDVINTRSLKEVRKLLKRK